ncbi:MAG: AI-2E family transporter [Bdellovibrionales bacterium]|nr:AI-2E family transporter [Bdellovibrionales bacterium]
MSRNADFERKELERKFRRQVFHSVFITLTLILSGLLFWKLRSLLLPIMVGALLAYLFRPLKDRFQIPWLHHELRVLTLFAFIGLIIFVGISSLRKQMPNERQKLELQVRLKYKLNEKFQQVVGSKDGSNPVGKMIAKEAGPMMDQINHLLDLTPYEVDLFKRYREGHNGEPPINDRYFDYFQANQTTSDYTAMSRDTAAVGSHAKDEALGGEPKTKKASLMEGLSIWMLCPIIFIFLGFDNGQMRRYFIGLVPNRYFELALTVVDELDDAIGAYLRGTLLECALVGLTLAIGFVLIGIPLSVAIAIGVISGLVNAIPFLGTVIGMVIGLGYALIAESVVPILPGLNANDLAIYVVILVVLAHVLDNVLFQPFVLGSAVNLHPLVVVVAIISGSLLMGVWGMLFAIPSVVVVNTAVQTLFKELKAYRII